MDKKVVDIGYGRRPSGTREDIRRGFESRGLGWMWPKVEEMLVELETIEVPIFLPADLAEDQQQAITDQMREAFGLYALKATGILALAILRNYQPDSAGD